MPGELAPVSADTVHLDRDGRLGARFDAFATYEKQLTEAFIANGL